MEFKCAPFYVVPSMSLFFRSQSTDPASENVCHFKIEMRATRLVNSHLDLLWEVHTPGPQEGHFRSFQSDAHQHSSPRILLHSVPQNPAGNSVDFFDRFCHGAQRFDIWVIKTAGVVVVGLAVCLSDHWGK